MYMQAEGWRVAKKDRIDLACARLRDAQGLITCPPPSVGHKPFHACLQVHEEAHVLHQAGCPPACFAPVSCHHVPFLVLPPSM